MGHGAHLLPERGTKRSVALSTKVPELFQSCSGEVAGRVDISHNRHCFGMRTKELFSGSLEGCYYPDISHNHWLHVFGQGDSEGRTLCAVIQY